MAGRGPAPKPKDQRMGRNGTPGRGDHKRAEGVGWQHGDVPAPPDGLLQPSAQTWARWMSSWFAAFWAPEDLPGLEMLILLYDQVRRGEHQRAAEVRLQMDTYGITPKGQQDRRWQKPAEDAGEVKGPGPKGEGRYGHLRPA